MTTRQPATRQRKPPAAAPEAEMTRQRILQKGLQKFSTLGFAKTTMDEIAGELGMSKKTLYKFFATKLELMEALLQQNFDYLNERCDTILASPLSAMEKLAGVSMVIVDQQQRLGSKPMMESVRDHLPDIWRRIEVFRRERKRKNMNAVITQGEREGTFRPGVDKELFDHFLSGAIQEAIRPELLAHSSYSMGEAFLRLMDIFMNGILTADGRRQYRKLMARHKGKGD